jgi:hypothetical protein
VTKRQASFVVLPNSVGCTTADELEGLEETLDLLSDDEVRATSTGHDDETSCGREGGKAAANKK